MSLGVSSFYYTGHYVVASHEFCFRTFPITFGYALLGVVSPYVGQQYFQIYGASGTVGSAIYPFGQMRQAHPGTHAYTAVHGYAMPGHHILQAGGPNVNEVTASPIPTLQATYPAGYLVFPWSLG
ncbi:hypothetical protein Syun_005671 [Stephania yunnanensis]|uniref:Uncharacterized protein n=1 Tax=Stephania yunnanensis TaxID=152371 RepID=A0AAP0Q3N8_9MAGN